MEGFLIIECLVNLLLVAGVATVKQGVNVLSFSGQEELTIYLSIYLDLLLANLGELVMCHSGLIRG